ncbi:hypothetical protein Bpfe_030510 [Biomphalaria pfeifferi]|uniref:Uncharacterized protein n=1 Tax=Biomphalaria pfeifferi TaxID=112525 RepID=A0AAD8AR51_BIOPF|nr:hypothetical protein Bpfe_030510 [Biomphalaria pfeifferi]
MRRNGLFIESGVHSALSGITQNSVPLVVQLSRDPRLPPTPLPPNCTDPVPETPKHNLPNLFNPRCCLAENVPFFFLVFPVHP